MIDLGRKRLSPISFSRYSMFDFLSKATCCISLKKRLKSEETYQLHIFSFFSWILLLLRGPPWDNFWPNAAYLHTPWLKTLCLDKLKPTINIMSSARVCEGRWRFGKKIFHRGHLKLITTLHHLQTTLLTTSPSICESCPHQRKKKMTKT